MNKVPAFIYICACVALSFCARKLNMNTPTTYTYLALGDSYTIGEGVPAEDNFPHQTVSLLKKAQIDVLPPNIIAKTGWTTDELQDAINIAKPDTTYNIVSLLIGVNNQYRGRSPEEYTTQFEQLLKQAIHFAGNTPSHVFVVSIPDWGATPFAEGRDRAQITKEIDAFNVINNSIATQYNVHYIDITPGSRDVTNDLSLVITADHLHPSAKEYSKWAVKLSAAIQESLK